VTDTAPILAFDTSGPFCTAAIVENGLTLAHAFEERPRGQAERLLPLLEEVLRDAGLDWAQVARIAVGIGPGNFTGIRIAVAAARGLSISLKRPALGVSRLEALALDLPRPALTCVAGRHDTIYIQNLDEMCEPAPPMVVDMGQIETSAFPRGAVIAGDHAERVAAATGGRPVAAAVPLAVAIGRIGAGREPGARPTPLYLRPPDAAAPSKGSGRRRS